MELVRPMKNSGIEWVGDIPEKWDVKPIFMIFMERKCKNKGSGENNLLSLSYGNIIRKDASDNVGLLPESFEGYNIVEKDNIVFRLTDLQNDHVSLRSALVLERGIITSAYVTLESIITLCAHFFNYIFRSYDISKAFYNMGGGVRQGINFNELKKIPLVIPPYPEQQVIADFLDCKCGLIDNTIEKQKSVIEKLRLYKQSVITEAVTKGLDPTVKMKPSGIEWIGEIPEVWDVRKLKDIGEAIIGLTYSPAEVSDAGILVLRSSNIQNGKIVFDDNVYVNRKIQDKLITKVGDILICSRNGSRALIGKCAYIDKTTAGHSFGVFMTIYRSVYNRFLFRVLNSAIFSFHIATFLTSTINQLTSSNLNSIQIPLPQLAEQQAISDYLDAKCTAIDNLINVKQKLIDKLIDYKKSLIFECVTGKREVM